MSIKVAQVLIYGKSDDLSGHEEGEFPFIFRDTVPIES